ncbi:hypothetical protein [Leptospira bouyouniensis]|uniref:hypothetical protein n=1 Tax=Leptospira bouyouniensis TaxID=2484911 RepID=UPI00109100EE|nr:hypothetical protein [Leptospira bouyouniensis]TGM74355.1 hypothetical protein EHQ99_19090 [Leptospira bouyouniensis]
MSKKLNPADFSSNFEISLVILNNIHSIDKGKAMSAVDISKILLNDFKINIHWRTITAEFEKNLIYIHKYKPKGKAPLYKIVQNGIDLLQKPISKIIFINPSKALEATIDVHSFFEKLDGTIKICDPYLNSESLFYLDSIPVNSSILYLTKNIQDNGKLRSSLSVLNNKGLRITIKSTNIQLHDRYIITKRGFTIMGSSLNGIGKNQSFFIQLGNDIKKIVETEFDKIWANSTNWV